jgi:hypothetical protein
MARERRLRRSPKRSVISCGMRREADSRVAPRLPGRPARRCKRSSTSRESPNRDDDPAWRTRSTSSQGSDQHRPPQPGRGDGQHAGEPLTLDYEQRPGRSNSFYTQRPLQLRHQGHPVFTTPPGLSRRRRPRTRSVSVHHIAQIPTSPAQRGNTDRPTGQQGPRAGRGFSGRIDK